MILYSSALITGASSGIGQALAVALARPGITLHLSGRDPARLTATATVAQALGATVETKVIDVCDAAAMQTWIESAGKLDLVVANAGISAGSARNATEPADRTRAIIATNLDGALNTIIPALAVMGAQSPGPDGCKGRIAAIASIAAFIPLPDSPSYCASKAALDTWMAASARGARKEGINLTSICPGYIRTEMTARNTRPMPGLMDAERAARIILRGIAAGRVRVAFPWWMALATRFGGLIPPKLLGMVLPSMSEPTGGRL